MLNHRNTKLSLLAASLIGSLALAACSPRDDNATVGEKVDRTIAQTAQKTEEAKAATDAAADRAAQTVGKAAETVGEAVTDAAVTAGINAELAKDPSLSALKIDVDTNNGRVRLSGTAPSAEARDRATRLANSVKGVNSVDNQLRIGS